MTYDEHPDLPITLSDLEREARRIRQEHAVPHSKARELAARGAGFGSYHVAREVLNQRKGERRQ